MPGLACLPDSYLGRQITSTTGTATRAAWPANPGTSVYADVIKTSATHVPPPSHDCARRGSIRHAAPPRGRRAGTSQRVLSRGHDSGPRVQPPPRQPAPVPLTEPTGSRWKDRPHPPLGTRAGRKVRPTAELSWVGGLIPAYREPRHNHP
eukprot:scaffold518_cov388-Prasinococcus_capsulatus_cf.AAC.8